MRAIPTVYRGTQFRSRLEASWAAHFDARRMPWRYEPEGFTLRDGTNYLPDFYLPTARAWAEVKGNHNERLDKMELFAAELWADSGAGIPTRFEVWDQDAPMVVLLSAPAMDPKIREGYEFGASPIGVRGPGKRYSTAFARCDQCHASVIVALWQRNCRNCGYVYDDGLAWDDFDWRFKVPFHYLPSPYRPPQL